jgi:hypothetical protein
VAEPIPIRVLEKLAAMRARGASWATAAANLKRHASSVRKWPHYYPDLWTKLLAEAEEEVLQDARAESLASLRQQLRNEDPKIVLAAGQQLLKAAPPDREPPPDCDDDALRLAQYARSLSDEELAREISVAEAAASGSIAPEGAD